MMYGRLSWSSVHCTDANSLIIFVQSSQYLCKMQFIPASPVKRKKLRVVKQFAQGHTTSTEWDKDLNHRTLTPLFMLRVTGLCYNPMLLLCYKRRLVVAEGFPHRGQLQLVLPSLVHLLHLFYINIDVKLIFFLISHQNQNQNKKNTKHHTEHLCVRDDSPLCSLLCESYM